MTKKRISILIGLVILIIVLIAGYMIYKSQASADTQGSFAYTKDLSADARGEASRVVSEFKQVGNEYYRQLSREINGISEGDELPYSIKECDYLYGTAEYETCRGQMNMLANYFDQIKACVSPQLTETCKTTIKKMALLKLSAYANYTAKNFNYQMTPRDLDEVIQEIKNNAFGKVSHSYWQNDFAAENITINYSWQMPLVTKTIGVDDFVVTYINPPANKIALNFCAQVQGRWGNRSIGQVNPNEWRPVGVPINTSALKCFADTYAFTEYNSSQMPDKYRSYILVEQLPGGARENVKQQIFQVPTVEFLEAIRYYKNFQTTWPIFYY